MRLRNPLSLVLERFPLQQGLKNLYDNEFRLISVHFPL